MSISVATDRSPTEGSPERTPGRDLLPREIASRLQRPVAAADLVADRPGARVWQVILDDRRVLAVKYTQPDPSDTGRVRPHAADLAAQQAAVLRAMPDDSGYLYAAGQTSDGSWLAVHWINKPNLNQVWQRTHESGRRARQRRPLILQIALAATAAVHRLHQHGWRHGNLQANHILFSHRRARLIDYTWAQGQVVLDQQVPYRGGWAYVTAPEIAEQLLLHTAATHHVTLNPAAEVYTLAAVLCHLWSGRHIRDFRPAADLDHTSPPDSYRTICDQASLRPVDVDGWPAMSHLFAEMLAHDPTDRPSITEAHERLTWLSERT